MTASLPIFRTLALVSLAAHLSPSALAQGPGLLLQEWTASTPALGDAFGSDLEMSRDFAVVGAPLDDDMGTDAGAVYLFHETGSTWSLTQKIYSPDPDAGDRFGSSVDIFGDDIAIGAPGDDERALDAGAAYGMTIDRNTNQVAPPTVVKLLAVDGGAGDGFGVVSLGRDTLAVGAPSHDLPSQDSGAVYVYFSDVGFLNLATAFAQKLTKAGGSRNFGAAIAVDNSGDRLIVSSDGRATLYGYAIFGPFTEGPTYSTTSPSDPPSVAIALPWIAVGEPTANSRSGEVRIYRVGAAPVPLATVTADDASPFDEFGTSIDAQAGRLLIGAPLGDWPGVDHGSAYLLEMEGGYLGTWPSVATHLNLPASNAGDRVGESVALASDFGLTIDLALVGGPLYAVGTSADAGGAWLFGLGVGPADDYCFGKADSPTLCAFCPCGNAPPVPGVGGGCLNGNGRSGRLNASGLPRVSVDTLRFEVSGATSTSFALLFSGDRRLPAVGGCIGQGIVGMPATDGLRCVGMNLVRHGTRAIDANGDGVAPWGGGAGMAPPMGLITQGGFQAGQTRYWQAFYRESNTVGCGTGLNTTQGVQVLIQP